MPIDIDVERLATYPMESEDWVATIVIGGLALLLSFLIVPLFAVSGYLVRALRSGMEDATEPPVFDEWGDLLREGFVAAAIGFVYQIVPIAVFAVFVGGSAMALLTGTDAGVGFGVAGFLGGLFLSWLLAIVFGYVGLAAVANYAREGTFASGFDFGVIADVVTSKDYLIAWAVVIGLNVVVGIVTGLLNVVPFLGAIAGVFVSFYALPIAGWLWGSRFAAATEPDDGDGDFGTGTAAV